MGAILILLVIGSVSLLVVRVGGTALMMTGMSWDAASFQAYSAFFGVGFTTREAEMVVNHPVRRRIIRDLILVGNIGLTSALATLVVTFVQTDGVVNMVETIGLVLGGLVLIVLLARIGPFHRAIDFVIRKTLERAGIVHAMDYDLLLRVQSGYCISEIEVLDDSPLAGHTIAETHPTDLGFIILGINRKGGSFIGVPGPGDNIDSGDVITVYGKESVIHGLASAEIVEAGPVEGATEKQ